MNFVLWGSAIFWVIFAFLLFLSGAIQSGILAIFAAACFCPITTPVPNLIAKSTSPSSKGVREISFLSLISIHLMILLITAHALPKKLEDGSNVIEASSQLGISEILIVSGLGFLAYKVCVLLYFRGRGFQALKSSIKENTKKCNELNDHIEDLKSSYSDVSSYDYGDSLLTDNSKYNMRRRSWTEDVKNNRVHNCSASVCKNANNQPFKYLCKYFSIPPNEDTLSIFEKILNNFSAAEQGKLLLKSECDEIVASIATLIPNIIMRFERERVVQELGFDRVDLSDLYFPIYTFQYVSSGGNSSLKSEIRLNIQNLDKFVTYLSDLLKLKDSIAGQRALMTSILREKIKIRDSHTCQICSLSIFQEKNLLLEIDHIIPLSKGGVTSEDNLQTLCWKCNRTKGAKILNLDPTNF